MVIMLTKKFYHLLQLFFIHTLCVAENNRACMLHLIVIEFSEVFHVYLCFLGIYNGCKSVKLYIFKIQILYSLNYVTEFSYSRRLNENAVRVELVKDLFQCFSEISHKAAAYTSGIHFVDFNTCIL